MHKGHVMLLLLIAIFRYNHNRINYQEEMKIWSKNKKVIHINSNEKLRELLTMSNKCLVS